MTHSHCWEVSFSRSQVVSTTPAIAHIYQSVKGTMLYNCQAFGTRNQQKELYIIYIPSTTNCKVYGGDQFPFANVHIFSTRIAKWSKHCNSTAHSSYPCHSYLFHIMTCPYGQVVICVVPDCLLSSIKGGVCEEVDSDLALGVGSRRVLEFPPPLTTDLSRFSLNMAQKVTKIETHTSH